MSAEKPKKSPIPLTTAMIMVRVVLIGAVLLVIVRLTFPHTPIYEVVSLITVIAIILALASLRIFRGQKGKEDNGGQKKSQK